MLSETCKQLDFVGTARKAARQIRERIVLRQGVVSYLRRAYYDPRPARESFQRRLKKRRLFFDSFSRLQKLVSSSASDAPIFVFSAGWRTATGRPLKK